MAPFSSMHLVGCSFFLLCCSVANAANVARSIFDNGNGALSYPMSIISDQDKASRDKTLGIWFSTLVSANLLLSKDGKSASVNFLSSKNFTTKWNYDGRGMELSDLKMFNGRLLSVDDKTGIVYKLKGNKSLPWAMLRDGDGYLDTPFKGEWLTVKDDYLYCGGYGKELTTETGEMINDNPFWVKRISGGGAVISEDWKQKFMRVREHMDIHFPGYMIHESAQWSDIHRKWYFLPRHMSKLKFDSATTYLSGANILLSVSEDFYHVDHVTIGRSNLTRGFSAFQFVPGTSDEILVALKSVEVPGEPVTSYIMVFDIYGNVLMDEIEIPGSLKCEGVEFYDSQLGIYPFGYYREEMSPLSSASGPLVLLSLFLSLTAL